MNEERLLVPAALYLVRPVIEAQDPRGSRDQTRVMRQVIVAAWITLASDASPPSVWHGLLGRLYDVFDDYHDDEDFLSMAAGVIGESLEMLAADEVEPERSWQELVSVFNILDKYLAREDSALFFADWLAGVRAGLGELAHEGDTADSVDRAQRLLDSQIAISRPFIDKAYKASTAFEDWPEVYG